MSFLQALAFIRAREGGYVDHPNDPGGPTYEGITQATYDAWRAARGLARRPVKESDSGERETIYRTRYWDAAGCDRLPWPLSLVTFDTAVQHGVATAIKMLQNALGDILIDGDFGPNTARAVQRCDPEMVAGRYCNLRVTRYIIRTLTEPSQRVFLRGWLHRVGELLRCL